MRATNLYGIVTIMSWAGLNIIVTQHITDFGGIGKGIIFLCCLSIGVFLAVGTEYFVRGLEKVKGPKTDVDD